MRQSSFIFWYQKGNWKTKSAKEERGTQQKVLLETRKLQVYILCNFPLSTIANDFF